MLRTLPARSLLVAALGALTLAAPAAASVESTTWEALVLEADALAEAECVTAGIDVARYRVTRPWKGLADGAEVLIADPGVHLVGDRRLLLLNAWVARPEQPTPEFLLGDSRTGLFVPLTYRALEADWQTPIHRGGIRLPLTGDEPLRRLATRTHTTLEAFHADVTALLAAEPLDRERHVLRAFARLYLGQRFRRDPALLAKVEAEDDVEAILDMLMEARRYEVVGRGRERALARLAARDDFQLEVRDMRIRLGLDPAPPPAAPMPSEPTPDPDAEQLEALLAAWVGEEPGSHQALRLLVEHLPGPLVEALAQRTFGTYDHAYWLAGYVCAAVPAERRAVLSGLAEARDPWLRVTAAVHQCFDDAEGGMVALAKLQALPGGPGAWAALTRARRGDAASLPRLAQVFSDPTDPDVRHAQLRARAAVLLSNAAARADLPRLPAWDPELAKRDRDAHAARYQAWFAEHGEGLSEVTDPWLPALEAQRVD